MRKLTATLVESFLEIIACEPRARSPAGERFSDLKSPTVCLRIPESLPRAQAKERTIDLPL